MTSPRVTYNQKRPNPFDKLNDGLINSAKQDAAKAQQSSAMDIRSKLAQDKARHSAEEYAPIQKNWSESVIDSEIYLNRDLVSDEAVREKIGLPPNVNLDMLRTDPNLWAMFPDAQARLAQHEEGIIAGTNAEAEDNKNWAMKGLGWVGDKMLDAGIKVGEAYELLWKPADMANEKLEHWFPEDATGVRRYLGNVLATTPLGIAGAQEGFQPRLPTPKQIQGLIQDSMADLNIGDNEQNERYKERILELKEEGMSDDEARLQAFEERTDIPGWVKFTLPIVADPTTYIGIGGFAKTIGRGATKAASGVRAGLGMEAGRDLISKGGAGIRNTPVMPKAPSISDVVADASEGGGKFTPKRLLKLIDPSSELKHLVEGSVRKILVGAHIGGKHLQEFADQSGSFMRAQAEGHFGKLDDLWGKSVLDDDQGVFVQQLVKSPLFGDAPGHVVRVPLPDVIENFPKYVLNTDQKAFVDYMGDMMKQFADIGKAEGLNVGEWGTLGEAVFYMARNVKGFKDATGKVQLIKEIDKPANVTRSSKGNFMKKRAFEEMQDGLNEGWLYENVYDVVEMYTRSFYRAVANERMITHLKPLMRTKKVDDNFPDFADMSKPIQSMMDSQNEWMKQLDSFINHGGTQISPKAVLGMKSAFKVLVDDSDELKLLKEDILSEIDTVLAPRFDTWSKALGKMDIEGFAIPDIDADKILNAIKAHRKGLKQAGIKGNIGATELRQAIKTLNITRPQERKLMEEFMKKAGDEVRINRRGALASLREKMGQVTPGSAQAWQKVQAEGRRLADKAANVDIRTEAQSAMFPRHIFTNQLGNDAKAAALMFDKAFLDDAGSFLKLAGDANSALRQMKTTWDLGAPLIQGLPILFKDASSWGKATGMMLRGLKDPAVRSRYVADNAEKISEYMQYGMHLGSSEMTEAGARGGWFAKIPRVLESGASRIGIGQETTHQTARRMATGAPRLIGQVSQRAQAGFDTYLDVARIEVMKGLEATAMRSANPHKAMTELAQFANKLTGVTSTKAMGVSATQRAIESALLMFSPRYTRATAALFMDMTRGGLRGDQARTAIASLFAGQLALHAAAAAALDQEVNLMPGHAQFMKVKVGDHWIGFGGKSNSLMNMAADVTQQGITDPKAFMDTKVWSQDTYNSNPLLKRLRYQMSPVGGEAISWLTGADPIGKTLPDADDLLSDPEEFLKYVGPKFMPFSAEALIEGGAPSAAAEFFGGVSSPIQPSIHRDELREKYVKEKFGEQFSGITWDKFKTLPTYRSKYALLLEEHPDLQEAEDLVERTAKEFESSKERTAYQDKSTDIRREQIHGVKDEKGNLVEQGYDQISQEFWSGANGRNAGKVFREKMTIINEAGSARKRDLRDKHPKLIQDRNEYFQGVAQENLTTAARNELFDFMASPRAKDAFGNINHQAIENFKSQIEVRYEKYGEGMGKIIVDEIRHNNGQQMLETPDGSSLPPLVVAYYDSWDVLRPFWDSYKEVLPEEHWKDWELFSNSPDAQKNTLRLQGKYQSLERIVDNKRTQMRRRDYEIDKYLTMFFDYAPENPKRQSEIRVQMSKMRMGTS